MINKRGKKTRFDNKAYMNQMDESNFVSLIAYSFNSAWEKGTFSST